MARNVLLGPGGAAPTRSAVPAFLRRFLGSGPPAAGGMARAGIPPPGTTGLSAGAAPPNPLMQGYGSGGMRGVMSNPLFHAGIGLLSQGPSLTPQSPWAGLANGLGSYSRTMQIQGEQDRAAAELEMRHQEMTARRRDAMAATDAKAATRASQIAMLREKGLNPEEAANVVNAGLANAYLKPPAPQWSGLEQIEGPGGKPMLVQRGPGGQVRQVGGAGVNITNQAQPVMRSLPGGGTAALIPDGKGGWTTQTLIEGLAPGAAATATKRAASSDADSKFQTAAGAYQQAVEAWRGDRLNPDLLAAAKEKREATVEALAQRESPGRAPTDDDRAAAATRVPEFTGAGQIAGAALGGDPYRATMEALGARPVALQDEPGPTRKALPPPPKVGTVEGGYRFLGGDPANPASWAPQ